jgi:K+-transporting ATPase ATPase C chain
MKDTLRGVFRLFGLLVLLTGVIYPLLVTVVAQTVFHHRANGSIVYRGEEPTGSELIGQHFDQPEYFWGRISATSPVPYTAFNAATSTGSTGSNYGPLNRALINREIDPSKLAQGQLESLSSEEIEKLGIVQNRIYQLRKADPENTAPIPVDLVTASASGLDPHISPAAAEYQVTRVAKERGMSTDEVRALVAEHTQGRTLGVLGERRVNVLLLNEALREGAIRTE